ncbi:MAG: hypothetical protein ACE5OO_06755, partial [Candidatus Bathyarchaeia archaeon]
MRELRKTLAYFLGVLLASTLGYQLLHPAFLRIADWLSPVFGTPLLTALMSAFLLFGDPLRFAVLPAIWSSVAFIGGLIIRRRVGAVATMVAVLLSFLSLLAASVFGIIETVSELGLIGGAQSPLSLLPPFPRGLSLAQLMEAPIVGRLLEPLLAMVEAGGPGRPQEIVMGVVTPLIVDLGEKLVVVCVSALVGVEVGKRVERRFTPWSEAMRVRLGGASKPGLTMVAGDVRGKALPIILIIVLPSVAVAVLPPRAASTDDYFSENLLGVVDDHGGTYVPAVFLDSGMAVEGVDVESPEVEGLLAAVLLSQESILDALPEMGEMTGGFDVGSLKNLMPPTALAMVYVDIPPEVAEERADVVSSAFSAAFGVGLRRLIAFTPPMAEEGAEKAPAVSIVVYQSPEGLEEMAEAFVSRLPVERGGLVDVIEEAYTNGRLIPGATSESADGAMFLAGFINLAALSRYVPLEEVDRLNISRLILPPFDVPLGFTGVISYWESGVRSPPRAHRLDLLSLLGVGFSPRFSAYADLSNLLIVAPNQTVGAGVEEGRRVIKLVTTAPLDDPRFEGMIRELSRMMTVAVAPPGSTLDPSSFRVTFSALLPLNVQVSKQVA